MKEILREINWVGPVDHSKIFIDRRSTNTIENALEVKQYMDDYGLKSLLLVTSVYHARRAAYIFEHVLPRRDYQIQLAWYEREPFEQGNWYRSPTGIWVTISEYLKFFWAYVRLSALGV
jgi:uncharacterized SAM-binding protein YcdF (DUF218 family)